MKYIFQSPCHIFASCSVKWLCYHWREIFILVCMVLGVFSWTAWSIGNDYLRQWSFTEAREECKQKKIWDKKIDEMSKQIEKSLSVEETIYKYADNPHVVMKIAKCESQLGKYRENWEGSGAEGLLMFKPQTFNSYCEGDIKNDIDQILCFNELYLKHPEWWECKV